MASPQVTFRLTEELGTEVLSRELLLGLTATVKRDLERYYWLIGTLTPQFAPPEAALIYDALLDFKGHLHTIPYVWAEASEQIQAKSLDEKWGVDGSAIVERLRLLSHGERLRLVDVIEQAQCASGFLSFEDDPRVWSTLVKSGLTPRERNAPQPVAIREGDH